MTKTTNILNELIEVCEDGFHGYKTASTDVKTASLTSLFNELSQERHTFITELKAKVQVLGEEPQEHGSVKSTVHRAWINIKSAFTGGGEAAILAECVNGDKVAVATYEKNLKEALPADVRTIVQSQLDKIRAAHDKVSKLEEIKK